MPHYRQGDFSVKGFSLGTTGPWKGDPCLILDSAVSDVSIGLMMPDLISDPRLSLSPGRMSVFPMLRILFSASGFSSFTTPPSPHAGVSQNVFASKKDGVP